MTIDATSPGHTPASPLERALTSLTDGPSRSDAEIASSGLWLKALEQSHPPSQAVIPIWKRNLPGPWLAAASVFVLFILSAAIVLPNFTQARSVVRYSVVAPSIDGDSSGSLASRPHEETENKRVSPSVPPPPPPLSGEPAAPSAPRASQSPDRFVIRKTTLDLTTPDVRGSFAKAGLVINEALGEYIEASSLTGEGPTAYATVTLRVAATRLSEALNALRPLGTVTAEASTGQDVTDTVVDLEARLRNEQRIERELLALIDKRPDAPLKDLMEIRTQLESVRGRIESLTGQREKIGRMVSLATILVTIRTDAAAAAQPAKAEGIGAYFLSSITGAWHASLVTLADTAAFLVRVVIGGIVWWLIAAVVTVAAWKASKRAIAKRAAEPAPTA